MTHHCFKDEGFFISRTNKMSHDGRTRDRSKLLKHPLKRRKKRFLVVNYGEIVRAVRKVVYFSGLIDIEGIITSGTVTIVVVVYALEHGPART